MKRYRIVDHVNTIYDYREVVVQTRNWFDAVFGLWWRVQGFAYNDDKTKSPKRNRVEALAEAKKLISGLISKTRRETETVITEY